MEILLLKIFRDVTLSHLLIFYTQILCLICFDKIRHVEMVIFCSFYPLICLNFGIYSAPPPVFLPPVTNYMLLYSTVLCKKIARAPGGYKRFMLTKLGGGGGGGGTE